MAEKLNKWDKRHLLDMAGYAKEIAWLYQEAVREAARISATVPDFNPDKPFSFAQYPAIKERVEKLINGLSANVTTVLGNGVVTQWNLANKKNDELAGFIFGNKAAKLPEDKRMQYFSNNDKALEAFQARKTAGMNLSDRVWNYTSQFKSEIEMGIDIGLRDGLPTSEIARNLKQYLKAPDKLFRRVRDEHGEVQLSKNARNYHPGAGVYRSSYKNAMRLARTETNMAYRTSDHTRWQQMDFVVGIEIHLSNNHTLNGRAFTDICDELQGKYPKTFKFTGWHPACRCFATTILKTEEELEAESERIMNGEEPSEDSVNTVRDVPDNFKKWIDDNSKRIEVAQKRGTLPYFLKDNYKDGDVSKGFVWVRERPFDSQVEKIIEQHNTSVPWYPTDKEIKQFEKRSGWILLKTDKMNKTTLKGFNFPEFDKELNEIIKELGVKIERKMIYNVGDDVEMMISGNGFNLIRVFKKDGTVVHDLFTLHEKYQGVGTSKRLFNSLYKQYKNIGANRLEVHANIDVGGYTWQRYGFKAEKGAYRGLEAALSKITDSKDKNEIGKWIRSYREKDIPLYEITKKYPNSAKEWLLGSDWEGYIDLKDESQRSVFEKYIGI